MVRKKCPRGSEGQSAGGNEEHAYPDEFGTSRQAFVAPRFRKTLPPLRDPVDVDLAVRLRGAWRRAVNRGDANSAARWGWLCAELPRRRAREAIEEYERIGS